MEKINDDLLKEPNNVFYVKEVNSEDESITVCHISGLYEDAKISIKTKDLKKNNLVKITGKWYPDDNYIWPDNITCIGSFTSKNECINLQCLTEYVSVLKGEEKAQRKKNWWNLFKWLLYLFGLNKSWSEIGEEVKNRKRLFLSAIKDLERANIKGDVQILAATDVFVEKAQKILTKRAGLLITMGSFVSGIAVILLVEIGLYLYNTNVFIDFLEPKLPVFLKEVNGYTFSLILFKKISIGAFFFGAIIFLAYIARALFHEGFTLYSKRHALRFGRLYVYLKNGNVNFKELEDAFQWNKEFATAFKDLKPEMLSKSALNVIPELAKPFTEIIKTYIENQKGKQKES